MNCRFCNAKLTYIFADLGKSPLANSYLKIDEINKMECFYPLRVYVCSECFLVQLEEFESPKKIFTKYAYLSSYSQTWLKHVEDYVDEVTERFGLKEGSQIIEIASNDGYLLQFFQKKGCSILGIEPAENVAKIALDKKIPTESKFFGSKTAKELVASKGRADFLVAFNVLPHVPDLNDFVSGLKILLKKNGIITIQFSAYILQLLNQNEFDTIYHEHFSYFSLYCLQQIFSHHGLTVFDVEELPIHGGSMRLYIKNSEDSSIEISDNVGHKVKEEKKNGLQNISTYTGFQEKIKIKKQNIWKFFIDANTDHKTIVGYGAPAKGNTLLNYCGIGNDFVEYTVDINPLKQGLYLPGTHIPIYNPDKIFETKPDYVLILAWNLKDEIMEQMRAISDWGGKFVVLIPEVKVFS